MNDKTDLKQKVRLREIVATDLDIFFAYQQEPEAIDRAAFTTKDPTDRQVFDTHWAKIQANNAITLQTILFADQVVGHISSFRQDS